MQQIQLSQGQVAILDDADFARDGVGNFHWCYRAERGARPGYATRHARVDGKTQTFYLHRVVMTPPPGREVIFLNHDRLDCRRENLRAVTREEARQHHRMRSDCKTGAKGVRYNDESDSWSAYIYRNGHAYHVGTFAQRWEAEAAHQKALLRENPDLHSAPATVERRPAEGAAAGCSASAA